MNRSYYKHEGRPIKVVLISIGSPAHYAIWNELSCETLAGDLRGFFGKGIEVTIKNINKEENISELLKYLEKNQQDILGLSIQLGSLILLDSFLKGYNATEFNEGNCPVIVFGNQIPTYFPEDILKKYPKGIIVRGEGEESLRGLVEFVKGYRKLIDIPNLVYNDNCKITYTQLMAPNLENLPYPPGTDTVNEVLKRGGNAMVQASRGCPWGACSYCTRKSFRHGRKWEGFPVKRVIKNIIDLVEMGIKEIEFCDDEFIGGRNPECLRRIEYIAKGIENIRKERKIDLTFRIFTRPDIVYKENDKEGNDKIKALLLMLKKVGLVKVFIGIESGCDSQMKRFTRGITLNEVRGALKTLKELKIDIDSGFIMFDPELTLEEMSENINFFRRENLMFYNQWPFRPLVVNEGSRIKKELEKSGLIKDKDINFIQYSYKFKDKNIARIAEIVDDISRPSRSLFYALKTISKRQFDSCKKDEETILAQKYIEENGYIYLDLMEGLCKNINSTQRRIEKLVHKVANDVVQGKFKDVDGRLKEELKNYGIDIKI